MRRTILFSLTCLLAAAPAYAEYLPGFELYRHSAEASLIVLAKVDTEGAATVVEVLKGKAPKGSRVEIDPRVLLHGRKGLSGKPDHAFLFLTGGEPVRGEAGIGWIEKGKVHLLPDNWGWGSVYPELYRTPTPAQFRASVSTALADAHRVAQLAELPAGPAVAAAASRLLREARAEIDWYVAETRPWVFERASWQGQGYLDEVAAGLGRAHVPFHSEKPATSEVKSAWREAIGELKPGPVRCAHLWLLSWSALRPEDYGFLEKQLRATTDHREEQAVAGAMLEADPDRAIALFKNEFDAAKPALSNLLLRLLWNAASAEKLEFAQVTEIAADLTPSYLRVPPRDDAGNLGYAIVAALGKTDRVGDLLLLLELARSDHGCRAQALVELRRLTRKTWEARDVRWNAHLASLPRVPARK